MSAAEWVASIFGAVGAVTGIAGLVVSIVSARHAGRSANHAGEAAVQARRSADAAARSNEIDAERRRDEREARHDDLAPDLPAQLDAEFRPNRRLGSGHGSLFGKIKLDRGYRVRAVARMGQSRTDLGVPMVVAAGRKVEFQIEQWHPDQDAARTDEIVFRFWPPVDGDDVPAWACGCGRPTGETMDGPGHWEQRVKVNYYPVENSIW